MFIQISQHDPETATGGLWVPFMGVMRAIIHHDFHEYWLKV